MPSTSQALPGGCHDTEDDVSVVRRVALRPPFDDINRVIVDLEAIVENLRDLKARLAPATGVLAVLKADAYGHGTVAVARALDREPALAGFVVTSVSDGLLLRREGVRNPIVLMTPTLAGAHDAVLAARLTPAVASIAELELLAGAARLRGKRAAVHVKLDTGMSRLGVRDNALDPFLAAAAASPELTIQGLCTHLSSADADDHGSTHRQLDAFARARARFEAAGHRPTVLHASNTAAIYRHPSAHLTHVRTGIALFGGDAPSGASLRPALRVLSRVAQLRDLEQGDPVSYGERWRAPRRSRVATVPLGYAHGYPRRLLGRGEVLVHGRRCPVVGAICMEMMVVDVTEVEGEVAIGDDVVLLGPQGNDAISADELARRIDGIVEEVFCGLSRSVPRHYRPGVFAVSAPREPAFPFEV